MPNIVFTGGGTAGHVTPNIALMERLLSEGWHCEYIGSRHGIEHRLVEDALPSTRYHGIHSGKLRRYFSWQNFIDPIFVLAGLMQSLWLLLIHRPHLIFSKGGFVAVPVVMAGWLLRIPVICHESDITPGLANKLSLPFCTKLCVNFEQTVSYLPASFPRDKVVITGSPIRKGLQDTDRGRGLDYLGFNSEKAVLMVVGGSLGARIINECIWQNLNDLLADFQIVHLVGEGNKNADLEQNGYVQYEYLGEPYGDILAAADIVVSRAGANSLYELLVAQKPHLLIPLSAAASRGDQMINAEVMSKAGMSAVLQESQLNSDALAEALTSLRDTGRWQGAMAGFSTQDGVTVITELISQFRK